MDTALKLIEKQIAMSDLRKRSEETTPQPGRYITAEGAGFGPCLLISRECGSGGSILGQELGERLGWRVFDAKLVDEIAAAAHVHQQLIQSVDEHIHNYWERIFGDVSVDDLADERFLRHLKQVAIALGHHGNVVIVGRGAQVFLPSKCYLSVRLVAPLETRVQRVAERQNLSPEQARSKIEHIDAGRAAFIYKNFKKDVASPLNQDLTINTGEISLQSASEIVLSALQMKLGFVIPHMARRSGL